MCTALVTVSKVQRRVKQLSGSFFLLFKPQSTPPISPSTYLQFVCTLSTFCCSRLTNHWWYVSFFQTWSSDMLADSHALHVNLSSLLYVNIVSEPVGCALPFGQWILRSLFLTTSSNRWDMLRANLCARLWSLHIKLTALCETCQDLWRQWNRASVPVCAFVHVPPKPAEIYLKTIGMLPLNCLWGLSKSHQ